MENSIARVASHKEDFYRRINLDSPLGQSATAHLRHNYVSKKQLNSTVLANRAQGFCAIFCFANIINESDKRINNGSTNIGIIVDYKDGFTVVATGR